MKPDLIPLLLVDDYERTQDALSKIFEYYGFDVDHSLNAKDAQAKVSAKDYKYIILDVIINGDDNNGITFFDYLKENNYPAKVIFITGCEKNSKYAKEAEKRGPVVYKDFDPIAFIKDILDGRYDED